MQRPLAGVFLAVMTLTLIASQANAQSVEDFYKGKRITLTVGYGPGGGYDVFARLVARHIGRFIPGNPPVIVQNMPGAGSLIAANYLYSVAPKDGTAFGLMARDMPLLGLMGHNDKVQFDPRKFTWLGSSSDFSDDGYMMIVRDDAPVKDIEDMRRPDGPLVVLGGTADGATGGDVPRILQDGARPAHEARARLSRQRRGVPRDGAQRGQRPHHRSFGDPIHQAGLAQAGRRLSPARAVRALYAPSRLPQCPYRARACQNQGRERADRVHRGAAADHGAPLRGSARCAGRSGPRLLQTAFDAVHHDPQFLDEAKKAGVYVTPVTAAQLSASLEKMAASSPELFERVRKLLEAGRSGGG